MFLKTITVLALLGCASAHYVQPHRDHHQHEPAHYEFAYAVHDPHTGDIKSQHEQRDGDSVRGSYDLIDADGFKRTVDYTADAHNGFQATVHRVPTDIRVPQPQPHQQQHQQQPHFNHQHQRHAVAAPMPPAHSPLPYNWHAHAHAHAPGMRHGMTLATVGHHQYDQHAVATTMMAHGAAHVRFNAPGITSYHY